MNRFRTACAMLLVVLNLGALAGDLPQRGILANASS